MKLNKVKKEVLLLLALLIVTGVQAQLKDEFSLYKENYPNAGKVRLNQEKHVSLSINRGTIDIIQEILEEDLYLDESAINRAKKSVNFSAFFEMQSIEASSFIPDRDKFREIKVSTFTEKDEMEYSFHDDMRSLNFIFPDLKKGAKSKMKYSEKVLNPRFLSPFYFGDYFPVINNTFTITAHKDINLIFKEFHTEGYNISFRESEKGNNKIYSWQLKDLPDFKPENDAPNYKTFIPHIIPIITSYKANGNTVNVLQDVSDLYSWYHSLTKDLNKEAPDPQLVSLVNELTAGKENEFEKVRAIYYWTQKNIKYIAFEYALGGFIPREANAVFEKKYGDCKDNSSILKQMLEIAGIDGQLTWIGTRKIPYTYEEIPTPLVDNHMILAYVYQDKTYYLDATGRYLPLELPAPFIQGKEALIAMPGGNYRIETVPVVPASENAFIDVTHLKIEGNTLTGSSKTEITGYAKLDYFNALEQLNTPDRIKQFYNTHFRKGSNKFLIETFEEQNKFEYDKNLQVDYTFQIADYIKNLGDEIFINLNLNKDITIFKTRDDRKQALEMEYKNKYETTTTLEIPDGYKVSFLPKDFELKNEHIAASIRYQVENNKVLYTHNIEQNFLVLQPEHQKEVNALIKEIERAYREIIILEKI
ncbi:MAG: DUF3857 domain-containing protein [Flavobacteriaceae bacterium]